MEIICPNCHRRFEARSRRIICPSCTASIDAWEVLIGQRERSVTAAGSNGTYNDSDFLEIPHFLVPERTWPDPDLVLEESYELRTADLATPAPPPSIVAPAPPASVAPAAPVDPVEEEKEGDRWSVVGNREEEAVHETWQETVHETSREIGPPLVEEEPAVVAATATTEVAAFEEVPQAARARTRPATVLAAIAAVAVGAIALYYLLGRGSLFSGVSRGNASTTTLENSPKSSPSPVAASPEVAPSAKAGITAENAQVSPTPSVTQTPTGTPAKTRPTPETAAADAASQQPVVPSAPAGTAPEESTTRARTVTGTETPGGIFTLQIAARSNEDEAKVIADRLIDKGYDARIVKTSGTGKMWYRVRVGMFNSREDAERYGDQLKQAGTVTEYFVTDRRH